MTFWPLLSIITIDNSLVYLLNMGMDQYLLIPFLGEWTPIYQLFWCSPGVQGFDTLPYSKYMQLGVAVIETRGRRRGAEVTLATRKTNGHGRHVPLPCSLPSSMSIIFTFPLRVLCCSLTFCSTDSFFSAWWISSKDKYDEDFEEVPQPKADIAQSE